MTESLRDRLETLRHDVERELAAAADPQAVEEIRVRILGRKGALTTEAKGIGALPPAWRSLRMQTCGNLAMSFANAIAASRAFPFGTRRFANPIRNASSPDTGRPVRTMSSALLWPIRRGSRTVPPSINGTPQRRQKTPNFASWAATRRSHHNDSSSPPATAWPSTAAMVGFDNSMRVTPSGPSPSGLMRLPRPEVIANLRTGPEDEEGGEPEES